MAQAGKYFQIVNEIQENIEPADTSKKVPKRRQAAKRKHDINLIY